MTNILIKKRKFDFLDYDSEAEFEEAVIEHSRSLFGADTFYIDIKRRVGKASSHNKGIPDGYLIDLTSNKKPQLYMAEVELSAHGLYSHITEQIARYSTITKTSQNQIRDRILEAIKKDKKLFKDINQKLRETSFSNVDELMNFLVDNPIKIVVVIDEATTDLNNSLDVFRDRPDVVTMKRFRAGNDIAYIFEPMREELQEYEGRKRLKGSYGDVDFDTIVCAAFEDGFKHAYINNNSWWAIRISQTAREQLRYLAMYEKSPVAAVQNYAEIEKIEPYKDSGKFIVYVKNKKKIRPIELDKGKKGVAPQSPRFTTLSKLLKAKKMSDLWK